MNQALKRCLPVFLLLFFSAGSWAEYDYPFDDRFVSTVVGTPAAYKADLPKKFPFKSRKIEIFPDREVPDLLFAQEQLHYSVALQKKGAAPLVFLIAGTGASHNGSKNREMARAFHTAGFHVISISSPTHPNFMVAASSNGVPGHAQHDAEDIYKVMETLYNKYSKKIDVTDFFVTGYSLGGFNTAFVAMLDEQRQVFNFKKALLINPPVSLYNSISLLDRMAENIPGGEDNFVLFFNKLMVGVSALYKRQDDSMDFSDDILYKAYEALGLKNEELAALVGVSFRLSSGSLVFTSDVMTDFGYVKPSDVKLTRYSDTSKYRNVNMRLGFTDYYHDFFYPYYAKENPAMSRDDFIDSVTLSSIREYLQSSDKIEVMHNQDDIILETGEIDFFREVFGNRAKIYPVGGHCGNMSHRDNVAHMVAVFKDA
jgi:hypothetical protein